MPTIGNTRGPRVHWPAKYSKRKQFSNRFLIAQESESRFAFSLLRFIFSTLRDETFVLVDLAGSILLVARSRAAEHTARSVRPARPARPARAIGIKFAASRPPAASGRSHSTECAGCRCRARASWIGASEWPGSKKSGTHYRNRAGAGLS